MEETDDLPPPIPAATLILMREAPQGGPPEILMMERAETMAFAAGALVFPGGRIDADDEEIARRHYRSFEDGAARIAAIRETIEETGIAAAADPDPAPQVVAELREALSGGTPFSHLLDLTGIGLKLDALVPFARWCPNFREARRFDTLFYLAAAPREVEHLSADDHESTRTFWATAAATLAEIEAERAQAIFPTRRNLERLARFGSIHEARADTEAHPVTKITPWVEERDGARFVCIPEGIGYPVTAEPYETARRR
jgi:8-oxo-dGTP pyrophosphatase MutT (NUDIX family)